MRLERGLKGRDELLKLVERHAGQMQELRGRACTSLNRTLAIRGAFSGEAQYTIIGINSIIRPEGASP